MSDVDTAHVSTDGVSLWEVIPTTLRHHAVSILYGILHFPLFKVNSERGDGSGQREAVSEGLILYFRTTKWYGLIISLSRCVQGEGLHQCLDVRVYVCVYVFVCLLMCVSSNLIF